MKGSPDLREVLLLSTRHPPEAWRQNMLYPLPFLGNRIRSIGVSHAKAVRGRAPDFTGRLPLSPPACALEQTSRTPSELIGGDSAPSESASNPRSGLSPAPQPRVPDAHRDSGAAGSARSTNLAATCEADDLKETAANRHRLIPNSNTTLKPRLYVSSRKCAAKL